jgi:hypothetical protein
MKIYRILMSFPFSLMLITSMLGILVFTDTHAIGASRQKAQTIDSGYSALKLFLEDEQHLTTLRRVKLVLAFEGISDKSTRLVDDIAETSEQALDDLEKLAAGRPAIVFEEFSDDSIGKATFDSLRIATAKELLLETDDFEKDLLLSQSNILRVISHLAKQLEEKETNAKRKAWLNKLAVRYEKYYQQVYARISITGKGKA